MKVKETIEILNDMKGVFGTRGHEQYSLTALDLAIESLEKQIPMKVLKEWDYTKGDITRYRYHCSSCESQIAYDKFNSKEKIL